MNKRPSISPEVVVRKSRLASKGEAVPALLHGHHAHHDHPEVATNLPPASAPVVLTDQGALLTALTERDRDIEQLQLDLEQIQQERAVEQAMSEREIAQLRADLERIEQDRGRERAAAIQERDQMVASVAAADATIDELRNRLSDLRAHLDQSRAEVARLVEQHAAERQVMLAHHKAECERLVALAALKPAPAEAPGMLHSAKRWLFGEDNSKPPSQVNQHSAAAQQHGRTVNQPRSAPPQSPGSTPAQARPSVIKPVGPPTAPKVLNRRPVG